ncbi:MAG: ABC transporter permease, partial [Deltaproteobacteria bacterium]|nr:ABC transporter permease [Deltaproteobacteria bacterium]
GLASASSLFLVSSGLSIIFGVTRIVNFAHGSLYMAGAYLAYSLSTRLGSTTGGFWLALLLSALIVCAIAALLEVTLLRRIYRSPELFQLVATFGVVLIAEDLVLLLWGPEDLLGPRAPGLEGAVEILGRPFPAYDLLLIGLGPAVLGVLWLVFHRTRWGVLVRAATEDREMAAALGINQAWLFTSVLALGGFLAGLGGAVQVPREIVHHTMDLQIIVEAFMVVVIGGLGSVSGAFLAAMLIAELNAFGILIFPEITLVLAFLVMAVVLVVRPRGLLGLPESPVRSEAAVPEQAPAPLGAGARRLVYALLALLLALPLAAGPYLLGVASELLIFALLAASLHFLLGVAGLISFGHAAYFGLGAYGAALLTLHLQLPMGAALALAPLAAGLGGLVFGWFCVRLSGVYLAMLTLAFAQITWSVAFQWYDFTGGDNGILGVWPAGWLGGSGDTPGFYYLTLAICAGAIALMRRIVFSPFGYSLRACRDSALRAGSIGMDISRQQWLGFSLAGFFAGIAGALYAFQKGSVFPDVLGVSSSVDALVMVLLGGVQSLAGPLLGAGAYKGLHIFLSSRVESWRMVLGGIILLLVLVFPSGITGLGTLARRWWIERGNPEQENGP